MNKPQKPLTPQELECDWKQLTTALADAQEKRTHEKMTIHIEDGLITRMYREKCELPWRTIGPKK